MQAGQEPSLNDPVRPRGWIAPALRWCLEKLTSPHELILGKRLDYQAKDDRREAAKRAIKVDTLVAAYIAVGVAAYLAAYHRVPVLRWLAVALVIWRALEILAWAMRITLFDRFDAPIGQRPKVASHSRLIVLGLINYLELWLGFATIYATLRSSFTSSVAFPRDWFDPLYFSAITQLTIGYGDVSPIGAARVATVLQGFAAMLLLILVVGRFVSVLRPEQALDDDDGS